MCLFDLMFTVYYLWPTIPNIAMMLIITIDDDDEDGDDEDWWLLFTLDIPGSNVILYRTHYVNFV